MVWLLCSSFCLLCAVLCCYKLFLGWVRSIAFDASNEWFATGSADRLVGWLIHKQIHTHTLSLSPSRLYYMYTFLCIMRLLVLFVIQDD